MKKACLLLSVFVLILSCSPEELPQQKSFSLDQVHIEDGPFYTVQKADIRYLLEMDPDRLLAPYRKEAGLEPKAESYGNWENTGLDGHIGGHYLSALAHMYASTGNKLILQRLYYMIDELYVCQKASGNGYLGGIPGSKDLWKQIADGNIDAGSFSLNHSWVPLYNIHKIYAGLRDAYLETHIDKAKVMLVALTDWMIEETKSLSDEEIQEMLISEHGGLNEVFVDVAEITGNDKYLELARKFSHNAILDPLLHHENKLEGLHANTQIPKIIGYKRYADATNNPAWDSASAFFWETVVNDWTISIGGNSVREHFHPANDFSSMIESNQGPESCNTHNMLKLTRLLHYTDNDPKYMDFYERALFNHILSATHPETGGLVYFTPARPRHYRVYSQAHEGFWCCVGSGIENPGKYGELIYDHSDNDIFVNLFIASSLNWEEKNIVLTQKTDFPFAETTSLQLNLKGEKEFALYIRKPSWANENYKVLVNNKKVRFSEVNGYAKVERNWTDGDEISVSLPMETKLEYLPDSSAWVSIVHGPVVLAAITDSSNLTGLWADDSRMGHVANGPFYPIDEAPMLVGSPEEILQNIVPVEGKPMHFTLKNVYPEKYGQIEIQPFFTIHEARYMLYWPIIPEDKLDEKLQVLKEKEEAFLALQAITVDNVATGEQQPESDHFFTGEKTYSGVFNGGYWRNTIDWYSYVLTDKNHEAKKLRLKFYGMERNVAQKVTMNGVLVATIELDGSHGDTFFDMDFDIPKEVFNKSTDGKINIKFTAINGKNSGGIYDVRLLKEN